MSYKTKELPKNRIFKRITVTDIFPVLPLGRIGIFIGSHKKMSDELTEAIEQFCSRNNAAVFCDHTSNYYGKYRLQFSLVAGQTMLNKKPFQPDITIHLGEITGDYYSLAIAGKEVWRVNPDGEIRDTFRKLRFIFEMPEESFFKSYSQNEKNSKTEYFELCSDSLTEMRDKVPEVPFSNIWVASKMADKIPFNSNIHFGILNSLRSWNFFELPKSVTSNSNVGGFGIDGGVSSLIGASLVNQDKLFFGIIGDLAFFYDMNSIGNRHVGNNLRILLVNNGIGTEFKQYNHAAAQHEDAADEFIAAAGHFGNKSQNLVKHYAQDLGFEYFTASNKKEFKESYLKFLSDEKKEKPMLFEIFTDSSNESKALQIILELEESIKGKTKQIVKEILGTKNLTKIRSMLSK